MTWIILFAVLLALLYCGVNKVISLAVLGGLLLVFSVTHWSATASLVLLWLLYLPCAAFLMLPVLRQSVVTSRLMRWFKASQPEISAVERDVLESGNIWVEQNFFKGRIQFNDILNQPGPQLTTAEQAFMDNQVETLCAMLNDWEITHKLHDLPRHVWDYIKKEKFWGLVVDQKYGGLNFSAYAHSQIVARIASRSISAALTVMVPNSLGPAEFLSHYGTEAQKDYYLPRLVVGEEIACFGLTAPNAGSDATAITDKGVVCKQEFEGKLTLGIRISFDKRYITLAPVATLIGLAFKLYDPQHLLSNKEHLGITLALVPAHLPGVKQGARHDPLDLAFMNGPIRGDDVFVPLDYVIGGRDYVGKGWRMLMECLSIGRSISLPALAMASASVSYRMTSAYAVLRKQFKHSIGEFEGVQLPLAAIGGLTYMVQATRLLTLEGVDQGLRPAVASAIAKYHTTELARKIVNHAMDIHGGRAIQNGPRNYLASIYANLPICITVEGANILTRCLIIYGQGALRCHPYLQHEIAAAMNDDVAAFDESITAHAGMLAQHAVRSLLRRFNLSKQNQSALEQFSVLFSLVSDVTMIVVGKQLKFKEALSARLGDILSYLYMGVAVLKYYENNGKPASEQLLKEYAMQTILAEIESSFAALFANYPLPWLGHLFSSMMLPRRHKGPNDALAIELARFMQTDDDCRQRLTSACYIGDNAAAPCFRVEQAWRQAEQLEPAANPEHFAKMMWDALQVDEFEGAIS